MDIEFYKRIRVNIESARRSLERLENGGFTSIRREIFFVRRGLKNIDNLFEQASLSLGVK